jgi:hypothetical protein
MQVRITAWPRRAAPLAGLLLADGGTGGPPSATPELDSLLLFGAGVSGLGGYALLRLRGRRRRD